jgi:hypothetical protein
MIDIAPGRTVSHVRHVLAVDPQDDPTTGDRVIEAVGAGIRPDTGQHPPNFQISAARERDVRMAGRIEVQAGFEHVGRIRRHAIHSVRNPGDAILQQMTDIKAQPEDDMHATGATVLNRDSRRLTWPQALGLPGAADIVHIVDIPRAVGGDVQMIRIINHQVGHPILRNHVGERDGVEDPAGAVGVRVVDQVALITVYDLRAHFAPRQAQSPDGQTAADGLHLKGSVGSARCVEEVRETRERDFGRAIEGQRQRDFGEAAFGDRDHTPV